MGSSKKHKDRDRDKERRKRKHRSRSRSKDRERKRERREHREERRHRREPSEEGEIPETNFEGQPKIKQEKQVKQGGCEPMDVNHAINSFYLNYSIFHLF